MNLSPHFTFEEMTTTEVRSLAVENRALGAEHIPELQNTCELLEKVRSLCDDRPMIVHSGFRCWALNAHIGGSTTSQHPKGEACDFHVYGLPLEEVFRRIRASSLAFGQVILEGGTPGRPSWVHLSTGTKRQALVFDGHSYTAAPPL